MDERVISLITADELTRTINETEKLEILEGLSGILLDFTEKKTPKLMY